MHLDLRRLKTFLCLADSGSLTRASDRLNTAQPALSRQISLLEEDIGIPLFNRHSRGMELTEAGILLREALEPSLWQLEQAVERVRNLGTEVVGSVALGLMPSVAEIFAGTFAAKVADQYPDVAFRISEGYAPHLVEWLARDDLDATLSYGVTSRPNMLATPLLEERMLLIGPPMAKLKLDMEVPLKTLSEFPLVLPSKSSGLRQVVEEAASEASIPLNVRIEADSYVVLKSLVATGRGYTVLPMSAVFPYVVDGRLSAAPLEGTALNRQLVLLQMKGRIPSRATRSVLLVLRQEMAQLVASGKWPAKPLEGLIGL